ncbi:hypothetical protein BJ912DRAFT_1061850 [Pholiota molesta]|nr:hypothetical protein BJ912DRAFT_1061850 [Pholiota molesta]
MSSVQQRALQSIKAFRHTQLARPRSLPESSAAAGQPKPKPKGILRANPFLPHKHKATGHWRGAAYSLRRQADLAKNAYATNTLELLPPGPKTDALRLRLQRVKASLSPALAADLAPPPPDDPLATLSAKLEELTLTSKTPLATLHAERAALEKQVEELAEEVARFEVIHLVDAPKNSPEYRVNESRKLRMEAMKKQIAQQTKNIDAIKHRLAAAQRAVTKAKKAPHYAVHIRWLGKATKKPTVGAKLGVRLYAGRKRMFKGHLWERQKAGRIRKRSVLMRDMAARVARYKEYYKKRKPNPLKPSRYSKPQKLPF